MPLPTIFLSILCLAFTGGLSSWGRAAEGSAVHRERTAIRRVVEAQLEAWRAEDHAGAYALAASGIRARYTLEAFVELVERSYPLIAGNVRGELGAPVMDASGARVSVRVVGRNGQTANYRYLLVREGGMWRIAGVIGETRPLNEV